MNRGQGKYYLDGISMVVSVLCMIHCIAMPIVFSTFPLWGIEMLEHFYIELATILLTLLVGGSAIYKGYRIHHSLSVLLAFTIGFVSMCLANYIKIEMWKMITNGVGATLVIYAHYKNWKKCTICLGA